MIEFKSCVLDQNRRVILECGRFQHVVHCISECSSTYVGYSSATSGIKTRVKRVFLVATVVITVMQ